MHIIVLLSCLESIEFLIKVVEIHLDFGSSREAIGLVASIVVPLVVVFSRNRVFVSLDKIGDHVPQKLHFC